MGTEVATDTSLPLDEDDGGWGGPLTPKQVAQPDSPPSAEHRVYHRPVAEIILRKQSLTPPIFVSTRCEMH